MSTVLLVQICCIMVASLRATATLALASNARKRHEAVAQDWRGKALNDPDYGGKNLEHNLRRAKWVIDRFGTSAFKNLLNETGMGNNPEMVRFIIKIAHELEKTGGRAKSDPGKNWGKVFYPNFPNV